MSLVITKQTGNFFSLILDGGEAIISEQNRLTTIGDLCNFKTANGANLVLKQNIHYSEVTVVASGTFTFVSVDALWDKLIEIGFFDGTAIIPPGTIVRFDQLEDTFNYFGRDGQVLVVNESELKLDTQSIDFFSAEDKAKLDSIETGAQKNVKSDWNESNPESDSFILNKPDPALLDSDSIINNSEVDGATVTEALDNLKDDIDSFVQTTAGVYNRINFTGDPVTIADGTFYHTDATSKGTVASVIQSVVNDDNQKKYFTQDLIGNAFPALQTFPAGIYAGHLSVRVSPNFAQQRYTVEIYKTNNGGTPIASGITGAPVGSLGVTVVAILDSGIINLADNAITSIPVSGQLLSQLSIAVGERIRYHVSAEKVGTASGSITMEVFYGSSYNSYYDVPVLFTTDNITNTSNLPGNTTADALDYVNDLLLLNQIEVSGNQTVQLTWNGKEVTAMTSGLHTIPNTLPDQFSYDVAADDGATVTWAITAPFTWRVAGLAVGVAPPSMTAGQFCTVSKRIGTNEIRVRGL